MHRNSKMFLAAVLVGSASGLASANAGSTPLGPPSPIGLAVLSTLPAAKAPASGIDPFTLSTISSGQGAAVVAVAKVADKSEKPDRSPGDKDHGHNGNGNGNLGEGNGNGNGN